MYVAAAAVSFNLFMPHFHQVHLADKPRLQNEALGNMQSQSGKSQTERLGGTGAGRGWEQFLN